MSEIQDDIIVGVDLDNTLICYDGLFHAAGVRNGVLAADCPKDKKSVRDWLIARDREHDFTLLQAEVYGVGIRDARPYPDAVECVGKLRARNIPVHIVSHKTKSPVAGPAHDLHAAALDWLRGSGLLGSEMLTEADVFFEPTLEAKAATAARLRCTHFIDDMCAFLLRPDLPARMKKIWFVPSGEAVTDVPADVGLHRYTSWLKIEDALSIG